jgi:1,4-dihydroxy-2-naphthoate octaprenyltransferase
MTNAKTWILASRPKTLVAAFVPVAVGTCLAIDANSFRWIPASLCLAFAFLIQIATNFANDYFDFRKGADTEKRLGPTRAVASGLITPNAMLLATMAVLLAAFLVGICLLPFGGVPLLLLGILSLLLAIAYTGGPLPLAYLGLGDIFVILFFGIVAVGCTQYVQTGDISKNSILTGLSIGLIINNLLVVNNYRDIEEDRVSGKKTLSVRFGRKFSLLQLAVQALASIGIYCYIHPDVPLITLLGLIAVNLAVIYHVTQATTPSQFGRCLQNTSICVLLLGMVYCITLLLN